MEQQARVAQAENLMDTLWARLSQARGRGDWPTYWRLRRSWLSVGRIYIAEQARALEDLDAQLTLLPHSEGRQHDRSA